MVMTLLRMKIEINKNNGWAREVVSE